MADNVRKIIIVPCYNEEESIRDTILEIQKDAPGFDYIVINDASTDGTKEILQKNRIRHLDLPINLGIGGAVQTGYLYAWQQGYDMAVQVDADGQHDVSYLESMARVVAETGADMVIGSRFIEKEGFQSTRVRRMGISYFTWLIRLLCGVTLTDPTSGLRLANRSVIRLFKESYSGDYPEPESLVKLLRCGKKVVEVPVVMRERQGGASSIKMGSSVYYMIKVTLAILIERIRKQPHDDQ